MVLKCGAIIPFQFKNTKKLVVAGKGENGPLTMNIVKRSVSSEFNIIKYEFYNKKIGFHIPEDVFIQYLEQRSDLTNFIVEIVAEDVSRDEEMRDKNIHLNEAESDGLNSATKKMNSCTDVQSSAPKKLRQDINNADTRLYTILQVFKMLFGHNELREATRSSMIKEVACFELSKILESDSSLSVSNERFLELTAAIVDKFPSEDPDTYYVSGSNPNFIAGGRLYESFTSQKCNYLEENGERRYCNSTDQLVEDDFQDLYNVLHVVNNWSLYFEFWQKSFRLRMMYIKHIDKPYKYFEKFIGSVNDKANELVEYDFENLHPGKGQNLFKNWERMAEVIFTEAISSGHNDVPLILDLYGNLPQLSGFIMLSYFLENYDGNVKTFQKEDPSNLIVHIDTIDEKPLGVFQEYCRNHNREDPIVFVIGKNTNDLASYVFVAGNLYWMETVLKAVDFCFKCYRVLRLPYPVKQTRVWQVIQNTYDIHVDEDKNLKNFLHIFKT